MTSVAMPMRDDGVNFGLKPLPQKPPMAPTIPTAVPNVPTVALGEKKEGE